MTICNSPCSYFLSAAHDSAEATLEGPDDPAFGTNSTVGSPRGIDPNTLTQSSFFFGKTLGEGSYARVVHAKLKSEQSPQFAIKIMEKQHIKKEDKVLFQLRYVFNLFKAFHHCFYK